MKVVGIIPARYGSSRFEGKPLVDIVGKTMIQRVYEQARKALDKVVVATDDERILEEVKSFRGNAIMTSKNHSTGTNRCLEASDILRNQGVEHDVVINVQGDEPLLNPNHLSDLAKLFEDKTVELGTLIYPVKEGESIETNAGVYVVKDVKDNALYFSRSVIPFIRDDENMNWSSQHQFYKHIGVYAYTTKALSDFAAMDNSDLEQAESLEQNRWLENGRKIRTATVDEQGLCVDTPEDLEKVIQFIEAQS